MRRLLTHLAQFSAFSRQGEVLCTRALEFLLEDASLREAFTRHVWPGCPDELARTLQWRAELRQPNGGRPDLEATTSESVPVVKVEAKLGAALTKPQLESYAGDLNQRGSHHRVLVVLVPRYRVMEARASLVDARIAAPITANVCVWEDVIGALERAASGPVAGDLSQFSAMFRVLSGDDVEPLADEQAVRAWRDRETAFITYVDRATRELSAAVSPKVLPLGLELKVRRGGEIEGSDSDVEPTSAGAGESATRVPAGEYLRRYVLVERRPTTDTYYSIGVRDPFASYLTPIWLRFHRDTGDFSRVRDRLREFRHALRLVESGGHVWIPIDVPLRAEREAVVASIVAEAKRIVDIARAP